MNCRHINGSKGKVSLSGRRAISQIQALGAILLVVTSVVAAVFIETSAPRQTIATSTSGQTTTTTTSGQIRPVLVTIELYGFSPGNVTLVLGVNNTVTWTNGDPVPHTVSDNAKVLFFSGRMDPSANFTYAFKTPGVYGYFCTFHPLMVGFVIVKA